MKLLQIVLFFCLIALFNSCGLVKMADRQIDEIQAEVFPLDSASKRLVVGVLEGATTEQSKNNIDTLSKRISYGITNFLNEKLKELDTKSISSNLVNGLKEEINDPAFSDSLNAFISRSFRDVRTELSLSIDSILNDLTSVENQKKLSLLSASLFSKENSVKLNDFINTGIEGISFSSIADSIRMNLLTPATRDSLNNIIPTKIDSILDKTEGILDKLNTEGESFIEKNVWTIVTSIASLMLLGTLLFLWRKKSQDNKMNDSIMAAIHSMENQGEYDALTKQIKQNALQRGIEDKLREKLNKLGLKDTGDS